MLRHFPRLKVVRSLYLYQDIHGNETTIINLQYQFAGSFYEGMVTRSAASSAPWPSLPQTTSIGASPGRRARASRRVTVSFLRENADVEETHYRDDAVELHIAISPTREARLRHLFPEGFEK